MSEKPSRRRVVLTLGATGLGAGSLGLLAALARSVVPDVLYEAPRRFPIGRPEDYPPDSVTLLPDRRIFVFRTTEGFHAVSAVCTHLGCNVSHEEAHGFVCPCHGSTYDEDGDVTGGPAAWPLARYAMSLSRRGELVVDTRQTVDRDARLQA
jgi:menaquinol-cytochrome c reductase iron-sulfur subunit